MSFTRFLVYEGRVTSSRIVNSAELDPGLLRSAREALARLKDEPEALPVPLPDFPTLRVGLSVPSLATPEDASTERNEEVEYAMRRVVFYLQSDDRVALFHVVPRDATEYNPGLFGMIAGSWGRLHAEEWGANPEAFPMEELHERFLQTAREIHDNRPAVASSWDAGDVRSQLADCLAAVLLSDE